MSINRDINKFTGDVLVAATGTSLGVMFSHDKEEGLILASLLGSATLATFQAYIEARKTQEPVLIAEQGKLFCIQPSGEKQLIRVLAKSTQQWEEKFKIK